MSINRLLLISVVAIMAACSTNSSNRKEVENVDDGLINTQDNWKLISPQPRSGCDLHLSFNADNKMQMNFRGIQFEGYYEIDSVLTNYINVNIFNKQGWDDECPVNPEYLTLYDTDTQFSYTILDNKLYFQKAEKVIVFERVLNQNI